MIESIREGIVKRFEAAGKRLTPERELLLKIIDGNAHLDAICSRCGKVTEVPAPAALLRLSKTEGFEVHQTRFEMIGYCKECLAELSSLREGEGERNATD